MLQRITFLLLILVCVNTNLRSQNETIDSIQNVLDLCETDTCRINQLLELASSYKTINLEMMLKYHHQAKTLLEDYPEFDQGNYKELQVLSDYYYASGEFEKTMEIYELMQEKSINNHDTLEIIKTLTNKATVLETLGQYNKAVSSCYDALNLCDEMSYQEGEADGYNNLAIIFFRNGEYDKSLEHFRKALAIRKKINRPNELAAIYNNLGLAYFASDSLNHAMQNFKLSIEILKANGLQQQLASGYINLAGLLTEQKIYDEALSYYKKALEVMERTNNQIGIANSKISIGEYYLKKNENLEKGIQYSKEGLELSKKIGYFSGQKGGYDILKNLYRNTGKYDQALNMYEKYVALEDSLKAVMYKTDIAELEQKYKVAKTNREKIELEYMNEKIAKNLQKFIIWGTLVILFLLAAIIGVGLIFRHRELKYKLLAVELEQKALKAQMNPHFIFNALVSIQSCIISGDRMTAYTYQSKFAKLLRLILQNSEEKSISLEEELKTVSLYIELEQFRNEGKFDFKLEVESPELLKQKTPAMLFQPFAENAIWHGLVSKKNGKGLLLIKITKEGDRIKCLIDDNGIGRKQAALNNVKLRNPNHKSMGVDVTKSRIEIFNRENGSNVNVTFEDKFEADSPCGTSVVFYLPIFNVS